jgi:GR25 family glycosyltransferase involved in LPS biosynthesis
MILLSILNLTRRPDRRKWMEETLFVDSELFSLEFIAAADSHSVIHDDSESAMYIEHHGMRFKPQKDWALSQKELSLLNFHWTNLGYTPTDEKELEIFFGRPVNTGELACFASHHAAWSAAKTAWEKQDAGSSSTHCYREDDLLIVLEDDVTAVPFLSSEPSVHHSFWREVASSFILTSRCDAHRLFMQP